jgi:hypothetical protein
MSEKQKLENLYGLLEKAETLASEYSGGYSHNFLSAEEFYSALSESIKKLKGGDIDEINKLYLWFAPTCDWDDFITQDGEELANELFGLLADLKKSLKIYSIFDLIMDYQNAANKVMTAFKQKYKRTDLLSAYRHDKIFPQVGEILEYGIIRYAFHGIGLHSTFNDNSTVDFDFAFIPEQRNDGFDLWRLSEFISDQPEKYKKYLDKQKLANDFNNLIEREIILKPDVEFSTTLYFFKGDLPNPKVVDYKTEKQWWKFWK